MSEVPVSVSASEFRAAMGRFVSGVTVVSTLADGVDHAMTANAVTSVSLDPPLVLICVAVDARFHEAVLSTGAWAVSVLASTMRPVAAWLASPGRPLDGQLDPVPHHRGPLSGAAIVEGSLSALECRTVATYPGGDHTIVVGEVVGVELPDIVGDALTYYRGQYGKMA